MGDELESCSISIVIWCLRGAGSEEAGVLAGGKNNSGSVGGPFKLSGMQKELGVLGL